MGLVASQLKFKLRRPQQKPQTSGVHLLRTPISFRDWCVEGLVQPRAVVLTAWRAVLGGTSRPLSPPGSMRPAKIIDFVTLTLYYSFVPDFFFFFSLLQ